MNNVLALVEEARPQFMAVLGGDTQPNTAMFNKEAGFAVQVLESSDYGMKVARGNPQSVVNAVVNIAAIGISLNPATKQAYLVPRDGKICLDISYRGLIDLATQTGATRWVQCEVVYADDDFQIGAVDQAPLHKRNPFKARGDIVGVYCVAKTSDSDYLTHCMSADEVYAIRNRSQGFKSGKASPWKTDEVEMIRKTCVKQGSKYWPRDPTDDRLGRAIEHLNGDGEGFEPIENNEAPASLTPSRISKPTDATDLQPKPITSKPATPVHQQNTDDAALATEGEISHIKMKAGARLPQLLQDLGLPSLDGLTKANFAVLRQAAKGA